MALSVREQRRPCRSQSTKLRRSRPGLFESVKIGEIGLPAALGIVLMTAAAVPLVVAIERAMTRITVYYPRGDVGSGGGRHGSIAVKLGPAYVWAPIAAGVVAMALTGMGAGYHLLYGALIVPFTAVFGTVSSDAERAAPELEEKGGFVPGYRPGKNTARHLQAIGTALAIPTALFLAGICVLPDLVHRTAAGWPPFGGYEIFLLTWFMLRILDRIRR